MYDKADEMHVHIEICEGSKLCIIVGTVYEQLCAREKK
jgi:hypothetical protein